MPIGEMGMTPHRAYRAVGLVKKVANKHMAFNILLIWAKHRNTTTSLTDAPLFDCKIENATLPWLDPTAWDIAVVSCPPSPDQGDRVPDAWWDFPNFDISVNYTGLLGGFAVQSDRVSDSVRVYLGLTGDINKVYLSTEPVSLFPEQTHWLLQTSCFASA
ncbi:hypothetical protein FA13DRAFT_497677 [Coprinellus micaceus]|uniref:Uncharacterized protein n=1 Tax=Coprinellus micaceus TaxID=71717 RepID=A0A4Y7TA30_COPMI|nr:hypothetical protein FA13DRAFT_497677 [Coprinellus micaceus]